MASENHHNVSIDVEDSRSVLHDPKRKKSASQANKKTLKRKAFS
jgi:hypothetical protein